SGAVMCSGIGCEPCCVKTKTICVPEHVKKTVVKWNYDVECGHVCYSCFRLHHHGCGSSCGSCDACASCEKEGKCGHVWGTKSFYKTPVKCDHDVIKCHPVTVAVPPKEKPCKTCKTCKDDCCKPTCTPDCAPTAPPATTPAPKTMPPATTSTS